MKTVRARWFHKGRIAPIRLIVVHSMEWTERPTTAEDCAHMFKTMTRQASAHVCVDADSAIRCVDDRDTAWAAPGGNADGLQMELAGYARQTRAQWLDEYGRAMLKRAGQICANWSKQHGIPLRKLSRAELKAGRKGIVSHADISAVYKRSDHSDPGGSFPWDFLLEMAEDLGDPTKETAPRPEGVKAPKWPGRYLSYSSGVPTAGHDVKTWQRQMRNRGWSIAVDGTYGPQSRGAAIVFQQEQKLQVDGIVGPATWKATWEAPIKE